MTGFAPCDRCPIVSARRAKAVRVWIDTDVGSDVDDALAIAYALRHPDLELVGISTVFGDVSLRSRIALALLEKAGARAIPVVTGLGAPLTPGRVGRMFGHEGLGLMEDPAPIMKTESNPDLGGCVEGLALALEAARPEALVAIGPMTNLGALAQAGHALPPLTIMGGKIEDVSLPGMIPQIPEWNWWCDPIAVDHVLRAPRTMSPRIVPGEVTFRTRLMREDQAALEQGDALARQLGVLCEHWLTAQRERLGAKKPGVLLHDPLAVSTLVDPGLAPFESDRIRIDEEGVTHQEPDGARVEVAKDVDNDALRSHLLGTWLA
jgi:inosine-uridine nucleoside N-ribohydrolase